MRVHDHGLWKHRLGAGVLALVVAGMPSLAVAAGPEAAAENTTESAEGEPEAVPSATPTSASESPPPRSGMEDPGLWGALAGNELVLTLSDGAFRGKLMGMQGSQLVLARAGDGLVVSVPTSEVQRVHAPIDRPRRTGPLPVGNGVGLIAGGGVMLGLGAPTFVAGVVFAALCGPCLFLTLPMLLPGGLFAGAGVGMLAVGVDRKRMWQQATYGGRLSDADSSPLRLRGMSLRF